MKELMVGKEPPAVGAKESVAGPATRVRYQVLGFIFALAVVTYIQRVGFSSGAPFIEDSLRFDHEHMGDLATAFLVAYGIFQIPGGLLGDRLGARHILTFLVLSWSLLTAGVALTVLLPAVVALQFGFLWTLRFLFGALQAGGFPVVGRIIADWIPVTRRGFAQGAIWMLSRLGGAVVPFLLIGLFRGSGGWPIPFVLIGSLGILWCAGFWPWFRNRPDQMRQVNAAERELIAAGRPVIQDQPRSVPWSRMARSLSIWSLCLMYGCTGFSGNFFTNMLPLYLTKQRHLNDVDTAWLSALPLAVGAAACVLGGWTSDWLIRRGGNRRWGRRCVGLFGLALAGVAFGSINWVTETWALGLLLIVTFFGNDLSMAPAWASCADIGERYTGTLSGTMNMLGSFGGAAGAKLAGYLFRIDRQELVFIIFGCVYLAAALCWLGVDVTRRLTPDAS
jgi:MFS transporter, ACS family, glucarate transporter